MDVCRPMYGHNLDSSLFINQTMPFKYKFNCSNRNSKFVGNSISHNYFGASHFVYYHNINRVIDFLDLVGYLILMEFFPQIKLILILFLLVLFGKIVRSLIVTLVLLMI